jgi:hypothetical protein
MGGFCASIACLRQYVSNFVHLSFPNCRPIVHRLSTHFPAQLSPHHVLPLLPAFPGGPHRQHISNHPPVHSPQAYSSHLHVALVLLAKLSSLVHLESETRFPAYLCGGGDPRSVFMLVCLQRIFPARSQPTPPADQVQPVRLGHRQVSGKQPNDNGCKLSPGKTGPGRTSAVS